MAQNSSNIDPESQRLADDASRKANWKRWGPYLSERQWGTVREDYSADGSCWTYFPHDQARHRAYRWGEDGLLGICDRECRVCFALAMWNDRDPILKERLFGLSGPEGNHGEDVKEEYYYLDSTPTHSYMKALYKYPQGEFPYKNLVATNARRTRKEREFELVDTGIFKDNRYFDVFVEYAKAGPDDVLIKITAINRGPDPAVLHLLPTLWCRNSWSWGCDHDGCEPKPRLTQSAPGTVKINHASLGDFTFWAQTTGDGEDQQPRLLFTDNETNLQEAFNAENYTPYTKDAFHRYVIESEGRAINPDNFGTKATAYYLSEIAPGQSLTIRCRLAPSAGAAANPFAAEFEKVFTQRKTEADTFYARHINSALSEDDKAISRQGYAGLLWSKQFYHYVVEQWLKGDSTQPTPPPQRWNGRNKDWLHLFNRDVVSMPDKWEYPWYASWDTAFHMVTYAKIDPTFAKDQLILFLREWYMHPNGQMPAYEFEFSDVNPPVHAFACWRVYKMTGPRGQRDVPFLERCFQKLLINFTWWVNRKDVNGKNIFGGGFLGLDNIGVFDRSKPLPTGGVLDQADGTAWMAFFCAQMLGMAIELARNDPIYEDVASKFFEHFVAIAQAINTIGGSGLWDEQDGFYYDVLTVDGNSTPLRVRSMVGLVPLFASEVLDEETINALPGFRKRMQWFMDHKPDLADNITYIPKAADYKASENDPQYAVGARSRFLISIASKEKLEKVARYLLDESEFLSPHGIRSLSRFHLDHPYMWNAPGKDYSVKYVPAESDTAVFGGNSNWRGPVWFPVNFLLIEAMERYALFYGSSLKVECPTGSGKMMDLQQVADELFARLIRLFERDKDGNRPVHGGDLRYASDPNYRDLLLFYEYFDGDNGRGVGASHQTGWTSLIARILVGRGKKLAGQKRTS